MLRPKQPTRPCELANVNSSSGPMDMIIGEHLSHMTIRGRAAFALTVADLVLPNIKGNPDATRRAYQALETAWRWVGGTPVTGDSLYQTLENENDQGLLIDEYNAPQDVTSSWVTITTAIAYVAWHAYRQAGVRHMPSPMYQVDEDALDQLLQFALQAPSVTADRLAALAESVLTVSRTGDASQLGQPIAREQIGWP